jgi:hypothetical protein
MQRIRRIDGLNVEGGGPVEVIEPAGDKVILRLRWREGGKKRDLHQLYVLRDGRVQAIRDDWSRATAMQAASGGA